MPFHWTKDHKLNVCVLGPMSSPLALDASCRAIARAIDALLSEPEQQAFLQRQGIATTSVKIPEEQHGNIVTAIFGAIDEADLVIVDISPRGNEHDNFSSNVFYELAMVHSLGIPCLVVSDTATVPFYLRMNHIYVVERVTTEAVIPILRDPIRKFLANAALDFVASPITDFYGSPIVDISAAAGVAAAYFENLIHRALAEETGFIRYYGDVFQHLITVRPPDIINHTYQQDLLDLSSRIRTELGVELTPKEFPPKDPTAKRGLSGQFVGKVLIDLPTTVYTLANSPRFRSLQRRLSRLGITPGQRQALHQASDRLVSQFEASVQELMEDRAQRIALRQTAHSFCTFENLPAKLLELRAV